MKEHLRRLRSLANRSQVEEGLSEEIRFHIDQQTEKNVRTGMDPVEARRQALIRFGGVESVKEQTRDEFRPALVEDLLRDLRYGIRLALGAESADVLRLVVGKGALLAAVGMGVGLIAALGLTGLLRGMLFGVTATDPTAFAAVLGVTLAAVLAASYLPARRAMKVAPVTALRAE